MTILLKNGGEKILEGDYIIYKLDISEEEFWEFVNEDSNCELINGVLVIHSPASKEHEEIFSYLNAVFNFFLGKYNKGKVYGSRFVMRLSDNWSPEPDLVIILPNNYSKIKEPFLDGPADLIVEILSKSTRELDLNKKLPEYLKSGVKEVWIIDPEKKIITLHHKDDKELYEKFNSDEVIRSTVFPDLTFKIKWLWFRDEFPVSNIFQDL